MDEERGPMRKLACKDTHLHVSHMGRRAVAIVTRPPFPLVFVYFLVLPFTFHTLIDLKFILIMRYSLIKIYSGHAVTAT